MCDVDRAVGRLYGVARGADEQYADFAKRMTFLIDGDGNIAKVYEVANPGDHPGELLDDLRVLVSSGTA